MEENEVFKKNMLNEQINWDQLVDDYTPYLKTVIQNMVGHYLTKEDEEEIIVDTFFVLWSKYKENYAIQSLKSYMAGITRNLVKEKLKKLQYTVPIEQCENLTKYGQIEIDVQEREMVNEVYKKIKKLKPNDYKMIYMFYYLGKSIEDIAKELKISKQNVKTRLHRIRKKIKYELKKGGFLNHE